MMYFKNAINRINQIEWEKLSITNDADEQNLGHEYLRRLAIFFYNQKIKPINPLVANVAALLGDESTINIEDCCDLMVLESLKDKSIPKAIVMFYLQLARYIDQSQKTASLLEIYEPLIRLLEKGFVFGYREGGFMIYNAKLYPLNGWYNIFLEATSIEIN